MTMQADEKHHGFFNSMAAQMVLWGAVLVVVIALAWKYVF